MHRGQNLRNRCTLLFIVALAIKRSRLHIVKTAMNTSQSTRTQPRWQLPMLAGSLFIATALLATWLQPQCRPWWNWLDVVVFRCLNDTLRLGEYWQKAWAFAGCRKFDLVAGATMFALIVIGHREQRRWSVAQSVISISLLSLVLLGTSFASGFFVDHPPAQAAQLIGAENAIIGTEYLQSQTQEPSVTTVAFHRQSPTLALGECLLLSQLVPDVPAKDHSRWSFPGDHGFILLSIALYIGYIGARDTSQWAWLAAVLLALPRLIAGAHWPTDIMIGSACMALIAMAILMATPLHDWLVLRLSRFGTSSKTVRKKRRSSRLA